MNSNSYSPTSPQYLSVYVWQYWNSIGKGGKIVADNKEKRGPGRRWTNLSLAAHDRCWPVDYAAISFTATVVVANTALEQKRADAEKIERPACKRRTAPLKQGAWNPAFRFTFAPAQAVVSSAQAPSDILRAAHLLERLDDKEWPPRRDCRHRLWPRRERPSVARSLERSLDRTWSVREESVAAPATPCVETPSPLHPTGGDPRLHSR
jgi:hypothetical protein